MPANDHPAEPEESVPFLTAAGALDEEARLSLAGRSAWRWPLVIVLGLLVLLGLIALIVRLTGGFVSRAGWGYYATVFVYLLSTAAGAPIISFMSRVTRGAWGRPIRRISALFSVVGLVSLLLFIPLLFALPPLTGRNNIWFDWPIGAPYLWDILAMLLLVGLGLALLYFESLPDIVALRDHTTGWRQGLYRRLSGSWQGTPDQWHTLQKGLVYLGAFYLIVFVLVHFLISVDFGMSLVPGWRSAIFPAYQAVTSFEGALAVTLIAMGLVHAFGRLGGFLTVDQFWNMGKLLLPLALFWFYFYWSDFITVWYGRTPREQAVISLTMFGPYIAAFIIAFVCCFLLPFLLLIWNRIRMSILGPVLVSVIVLIGLFFDRIRFYVAAYSIKGATGDLVGNVPPPRYPDLADVLLILGGLAAAALVYLAATVVLPALSVWELKEGLLLTRVRKFLLGQVIMIGKPK